MHKVKQDKSVIWLKAHRVNISQNSRSAFMSSIILCPLKLILLRENSAPKMPDLLPGPGIVIKACAYTTACIGTFPPLTFPVFHPLYYNYLNAKKNLLIEQLPYIFIGIFATPPEYII